MSNQSMYCTNPSPFKGLTAEQCQSLILDRFPNEFLLVDLEYTTWEGAMEADWSRGNEGREIVQLAGAKIELTEEGPHLIDRFNNLIRTHFYPELSDYFIALTGITQEKMEQEGRPFLEVMNEFERLANFGKIPLYCWGTHSKSQLPYDFHVVIENCNWHKRVFNSSLWNSTDVSRIFPELGVDTAGHSSGTIHRALGIKLDGHVHDGMDDVISVNEALRHAWFHGTQ